MSETFALLACSVRSSPEFYKLLWQSITAVENCFKPVTRSRSPVLPRAMTRNARLGAISSNQPHEIVKAVGFPYEVLDRAFQVRASHLLRIRAGNDNSHLGPQPSRFLQYLPA